MTRQGDCPTCGVGLPNHAPECPEGVADQPITPAEPPRLWELGEALGDIYAELSVNGGVLTPELEEALDAIGGAFEEKCERTAFAIKRMEANAEMVKAEEKRLKARRDAFETGADRLRAYLLAQMQRVGKTAVERPLLTIRVQKSESAKATVPLHLLRPDLVRVKESEEFNAQRALEIHRSGAPLPAGVVVTVNPYLRFY